MPTPDPRIRWGIPAAVVALVLFAATIAAGLALTPVLLRATQMDPNALGFWATVVLDAVIVLICAVIVRVRGSGSLVRDLGLRFRPVDLALGPGTGLAAKVIGVLALALVLVLTRVDLSGLRSNVPFERSSVWSWLLLGIVGCILAPFAEELLFRGIVLGAVRHSILRRRAEPSRGRRAATAIVAVAVSAVLFAGFHLYEATSPLMAAVLGSQILLIGIVHGVLVVVTGRLGPAILSHVANNAIAFALVVALPDLGHLTG